MSQFLSRDAQSEQEDDTLRYAQGLENETRKLG